MDDEDDLLLVAVLHIFEIKVMLPALCQLFSTCQPNLTYSGQLLYSSTVLYIFYLQKCKNMGNLHTSMR